MDSKVHLLDAQHAIVTSGPVLIRVIDSAKTEPADIDYLVARFAELLERYPVGGMWIVVHHGAPIPDAHTRRHSGKVLKPYKDRLSLVYSMLGLGFWSGAAITATVALARFIGVNAPIATSVEEGAQRLSMELVGIDPQQLISIYEDLYARMRAL